MDARPTELSSELRAFLFSCIDGVEQLELLLLLYRSGRTWTVRDVSAVYGLPEPQVRVHLETLTARGLLVASVRRDITFEYHPRTESLRAYCEQLSVAYADLRGEVLRAISTPRASIKRFADAFKLREPE